MQSSQRKSERPALRRAFEREKALRPMRGWPQNPFLDRSLVVGTRDVKGESQNLS